jgi:hypothetical protein
MNIEIFSHVFPLRLQVYKVMHLISEDVEISEFKNLIKINLRGYTLEVNLKDLLENHLFILAGLQDGFMLLI